MSLIIYVQKHIIIIYNNIVLHNMKNNNKKGRIVMIT